MDDSFVWKSQRPWPNKRLKKAAIVGHTTAHSTRLWLRTGSLGSFRLLVFPLSADDTQRLLATLKKIPFTDIKRLPQPVRTFEFTIEDYLSDTTHVVEIDGLEAGAEYGYALLGQDSGNQRVLLGHDQLLSFCTEPEDNDELIFGFYSCHMPYKQSLFGRTSLTNMEMWECFERVLERKRHRGVAMVIGGGDQVYTDGVDSLDIWRYLNKVARKKGGEMFPQLDAMLSWYRDIYRGYWGFESLQNIYARFPNYMIWDDHELADGWGSHKKGGKHDEINEIFGSRRKNRVSKSEAYLLVDRMQSAAHQVYQEYQHSHNPVTQNGVFDYPVEKNHTAFYFLDGRGQRDINRAHSRILGEAQMERLEGWLNLLDAEKTPFIFIVSAVPLLHLYSVIANADDNVIADIANIQDDLRDAWEHELHKDERKALFDLLFRAARQGFKVCILSGDVHVSAAFRLTDKQSGKHLYQLTSSAITYNNPRALGWILGKTVAEEGESPDGFHFKRLALFTDSNFSLINVNAPRQEVTFELYGRQSIQDPYTKGQEAPVPHALAKLELRFD